MYFAAIKNKTQKVESSPHLTTILPVLGQHYGRDNGPGDGETSISGELLSWACPLTSPVEARVNPQRT